MDSITILDSTLRDGAQGEGISFSIQDKLQIVRALDEIGIPFIEAGNPGSNPKDLEFFSQLKSLSLKHSQIVAFGSTRRPNETCEKDANITGLLAANTNTVAIFGKAWDFHVTDVLRTTLEENLLMISDTVSYLVNKGLTVFYDAEHFFDACRTTKESRDYAFKTLEAAALAGAQAIILCDTNGGTMPADILNDCRLVTKFFDEKRTSGSIKKDIAIGIHCHNDSGVAVANSLMAVEGGVTQVQGTLLGIGERSGNANLSAIIPDLELKMNRSCLPDGHLVRLYRISRLVAEVCNIKIGPGKPFIGSSAFAHKAGMHADAILKNSRTYEHIDPSTVGNDRVFLLSEITGRALLVEKLRAFLPEISENTDAVKKILDQVKQLEFEGYQFEGADASFEIMVRKSLGIYKPFFNLHYYKTMGEWPRLDENICSFAQLKIDVDGAIANTAGEGDGPVHALDIALRKALERFYPAVAGIRLTDYKVRVLDSKSATAAKVRVLIETTDGKDVWSTVGVSSDVMEASWLALVDSFEYKLFHK